MRHTFIFGSLCILCLFVAFSHGLFLLGCDDDDDDSKPSPTATTAENTPTPTPTPIVTPTATSTPEENPAEVQIWTKPVEVTGNEMLLTNTQTMEEWRFINTFEALLAEGPYTLEAFPYEYWLPEKPSQDFYFQAGEYYGIEVVYYPNIP
ncbi:hypothetical protein JXQ70_00740 [bacterium]|nr:hypothetical protein [bacterium]